MKHLKFIGILILIAFRFAVLPAVGKDTGKALADSIKAVNDTRIYAMAERYHMFYAYQEPKSVLAAHQKALKLALKTGNEKEQAVILHRIALCLYLLKEDKKALDYDMQSLKLCRKFNLTEGLAKAYTSIGKCYLLQNDIPLAAKYLTEGYRFARLNEEAVYINNALELLVILAHEQGDKLAEIRYNKEAYQLSIQQNRTSDIAFFGIGLGLAYHNNSQYDQALKYFEASRLILEKSKDNASLSKVYNNMGNSFVKLGNYEKGLQYYLKSLELKEDSSSPKDISVALLNLGSIYLRLEQYPKALEHYSNALQLKKELRDNRGMASIYSSMGIVYRHLGQNDKALQSYNMAVKLYRKDADNQRLAQTLNNIGVLYSEQGKLDQALEMYDRSLKLKGIKSDDSARISSLLNIVDIYLNKQVDLSKASTYLKMVQNLPSLRQLPDLRVRLYTFLSTFYGLRKDYASALYYSKAYSALQDSIYTNLNSRSLAELDVKYELSSKGKQINMLQKNAELNKQILSKSRMLRNYLIVIILLVVVIAVVIMGRYRTLKNFNQLIIENDAQLKKLNQSLEQRVESEIAIRRQQEQKAFQQARLAALGELAAGIAHELNQPLHSLAFTLDNILLYLKEDKADPEYLNQKLDYLFDDISRMRNAIDHIRHFAKQKSDVQNEVFYVNDCIRQTVNLVLNQYQKLGITIVSDLQDGMPGVKGNPYKLEQVMLNLLSNSRDAVIARASVRMNAETPTIRISSATEGEKQVIRCIDNGSGMTDEVKEKAFQSFYSTKEPDQGTGLGLTISQGIITDMGGEIRLESSTQTGTTVSVILPCSTKGA